MEKKRVFYNILTTLFLREETINVCGLRSIFPYRGPVAVVRVRRDERQQLAAIPSGQLLHAASAAVGDGEIGARYQQLADVRRGRDERAVQGRVAVRVRQIRVRAVPQQQPHDVGAAPRGRAVQRGRAAATGARVHVGAVPQQRLAHAVMCVTRGVVQRPVAGGVLRVGGRAVPQQRLHARQVVALG